MNKIMKWQKIKCIRGHDFNKANTAYHPKSGAQVCKKCNAERSARYRARKKLK